MIPEGWSEARLGDVASLIAGINKPLSAMGRGTLYLTVQELYVGSCVDPDMLGRIDLTPDEVARFCLQPGDIVFGKSSVKREGIGYPNQFVGAREPVAHSGFTYAARPHAHVVHARYLFHALRNEPSRKWLINNSQASALTNINAQIANAIPVLLPPLREQRAIEEALSDADALVESLDALIAKKRDVKQAAMQQLLTGRTRLPGFTDEWQTRQFAELCTPRSSRIDPRVSGGGDFCVELEHLESGTARLLGSGLTTESSSLKTKFTTGDVLFGKLRSYLRKSWLADRSGVCSTEIWVLAASPEVSSPRFLAQVVQTDRFVEASSMSYGTHMPRSDWSIVSKHELAAPSLPEQEAIGTVLLDLDAEIDALVAQREKAELVKQGMMQELLSGRVRLA